MRHSRFNVYEFDDDTCNLSHPESISQIIMHVGVVHVMLLEAKEPDTEVMKYSPDELVIVGLTCASMTEWNRDKMITQVTGSITLWLRLASEKGTRHN